MSEKRTLILLLTLASCLMALAIRAFYLQVYSGNRLSTAASSQRVASSSIEKERGNVIDRNGIQFTNREKKYTIVLKPLYLRDKKEDITKICEILELDYAQIYSDVQIKRQPILVEADEQKKNELTALDIKGISVIYSKQRYGMESLARHIIGYLKKSDQVGQTGIEKSYESQLSLNVKNTVGVVTDAKNNLVQGLGYRINKSNITRESNIKLTLDYHIQKIVEDKMESGNITGAVVVEEVNSGDIVAIASKPDYDQNNVSNYLNGSDNELFNRATAAYNIGSVFKIVDAAAAFENVVIAPRDFICTGSIMVGSKEFKCSSYSNGGHGLVNFEQAFAESCNPYFIQLGLSIGYKQLVAEAEKFGFGNYTGLKDQGVSEYKGNLPQVGKYYSGGDIANLSIGQGAFMATPVQVADMVATIANGGIKNKINIVDSIVDKNGNKLKDIKVKSGQRIVSKETAEAIKRMMESVTRYGTGTAANLDDYGGSAGKTGSAETGKDGVVHAWFAGYFPLNEPKYSIAVFVENGQYGGKAAAPVFADIAAEIMKKGF